MYEVLRKAIKKILLEEFHTNDPALPYNNSLNQTSDSGNVNYEFKINEFYSINEYDSYDNLGETFKLIIKVREDHKKKFLENNISIKPISYESNDLNIFKNEKRNIINKLYTILGNKGII
tara:strand:- start:131 stop:490 length:360 start_codon:yes stop_codon:yes gene_type:complete